MCVAVGLSAAAPRQVTNDAGLYRLDIYVVFTVFPLYLSMSLALTSNKTFSRRPFDSNASRRLILMVHVECFLRRAVDADAVHQTHECVERVCVVAVAHSRQQHAVCGKGLHHRVRSRLYIWS